MRPVATRRMSRREAELDLAVSAPNEGVELRRARRLKDTIEQYWRDRGYDVVVKLDPLRVKESGNVVQPWHSYALSSNTLNGWPLDGAS